MEQPSLRFLTNEAGEKEGLGDAGIETFRDTPYASCAREAGQNARDVPEQLPVHMAFNLLRLTPHDFPAQEEVLNAIKSCQEQVTNERDQEFFGRAREVICGDQIPVLEIADYSTKGLKGPPNESGTPFHSLVKGSGVTVKDSPTSGGSFGIGKNASLAVSDIQMVMYSTQYIDESCGEKLFAAQGKIRLVSHGDSTGEQKRATGYWGNPENFSAITDIESVPNWMARSEIGTSIFCMGFRESEDWAERMVYSLVSNFFAAIHREEMRFEVDNKRIVINRGTLEGLLNRADIALAAEGSGHLADLEFAKQLYRCLASDNAEEHVIEIPGLGEFKVRLLVEEGMPSRVGFIRNGILITDNLKNFSHPLQRFPNSRDFIATVEPNGEKPGRLLKRLENPAHNAFSAERIADPSARKEAVNAMKALGKELRQLINSSTGVRHEGAIVVDELAQYFSQPGEAGTPPDPEAEDNPEKFTYEIPPRTPSKRRVPVTAVSTEGGEKKRGKNSGEGSRSGAKPRGGGSSAGQAVTLFDVRNRCRLDESGTAQNRELHFTPEASGTIRLKILATGVNEAEQIMITRCDKGVPSNGAVEIAVENGKRESLVVSMETPYPGPIELVASLVDAGEKEEVSA
jgi:hypothetical protein